VDLAWLRTTPWRERLAASFDTLERRAALRRIGSLAIRHHDSSRASALLLTGWLASRLQWRLEPLQAIGAASLRGVAHRSDERVSIALEVVEQDVPGLAGVTVTCTEGFSLSLDRAPGGLRAAERSTEGEQRSWQVLGASRGEGGILGEGVRLALMRDTTYGPALDAARSLCP
jgi:glucose-6-phosphate dehydrogenase assembly protein OpcA